MTTITRELIAAYLNGEVKTLTNSEQKDLARIALASLDAGSDSNDHPAQGPLSNDRLHRIREILGKAAAQSDGGNIGYAMSDAVKAIDELLEVRKAEPVAWLWTNERLDKQSVSLTDPADEENTQDAMACGWKHQPLYTVAPVFQNGLQQWVSDVIEYLENGLEADGELEAQGSIDAKRLLAAAPQQEE